MSTAYDQSLLPRRAILARIEAQSVHLVLDGRYSGCVATCAPFALLAAKALKQSEQHKPPVTVQLRTYRDPEGRVVDELVSIEPVTP